MLNRSGEMEVFVRAVEAGSLSGAAHALHLTPSAISKLLSRLEARLGVTLLRRSARALALTAEGERYFERARVIVREIELAENNATLGAPRGVLRVNCNIPFAQHWLLPRLPFPVRFPPQAKTVLFRNPRYGAWSTGSCARKPSMPNWKTVPPCRR